MIFKPEFIQGNRGRDIKMTWSDAAHYNGVAKEEKGRENSSLHDGYGRDISVDEAVGLFGGVDATYTNAIANPSEKDRVFLEEKYGGKSAAQHGIALALLDRLGARDGVYAVHDHGENGWHLHLSFRDNGPSRLFTENGKLQVAYDRETELLRGEAGRPIVDWEAHGQYKDLRVKLMQLQKVQRELDKERYQALRNAPKDQKNMVRGVYEQRELTLIHRRREIEFLAAQARYTSRNMVGCAAHEVEKERIERRTATAITRMDARTMRQVLAMDRKIAWKEYRTDENRHRVQMSLLEQELQQVRQQAKANLDQAKDQADRKGKLGTSEYAGEVIRIQSRLEYEEANVQQKGREIQAQYRRSRAVNFARGPLSLAYLESREAQNLISVARKRLDLDIAWTNKKHGLQGTLGSLEHGEDLKGVHGRFQDTQAKYERRATASAGRAVQTSSRQATRKGMRAIGAGVTQAVKSAHRQATQQARDLARPDQPGNRDVKAVTGGAKSAAEAAVKAAMRTAAAAAKTGGKVAWEAGYAASSAGAKLAAGAILAIPTGGASLKTAGESAGKDLAKGGKVAGREAIRGAKETGEEATRGGAQTALATARGVKGLTEDLLPKPLEATTKAMMEAGKTVGNTALKTMQFDLTGAAKTALLGGARTAKEASGAALTVAELPAVMRIPAQLLEKVPIVGTLASVARTAIEITASTAGGMELSL